MQTDFGYEEDAHLGKPYDLKLLRALYPYVRPFKRLLVGSILLVVMITILDLAVPYVTKIAIDRHIVPREETGLTAGLHPDGENRRFLRVDLNNPESRRIIARHPELFRVDSDSDTARISMEDLQRLEKEEIAVLRQDDLTGLVWVSALFLVIVVIDFFLNFFQRVIMEYTGHMIMHRMRLRLFGHIQRLSIEFFTHNPVGRLVTRVTNDVQNMHELFTSFVSFVFKDMFLLFGIAAVLLVLNWKLALATFTVLPLVACASVLFSLKARDIFRILRIKIAEINTRFSETIGGIKVIQVFGSQAHNFGAFKKLNHDNYLAGMQQIRVLGIFLPAVEVLGVFAIAIVIYYGGGKVLSQSLSLGELVAFMSYMRMFFRPIRDLAEKYNILQNAMASAERIFLIFNTSTPSETAQEQGDDRASELGRIEHIRFDDVSFGYVPGEPVLKNISFSIQAGETIGIVGPTGAGKTSLINLINRFYDPSQGRIRLNGRDIRAYPPAQIRSKTALVTQDPFLFSESIRENIFRGNGQISAEELDTILDVSNCRVLTDRLPQGVDTVLSEGGASISSGERQLISIARAFARDPQLILFDEATSYVDSQTEVKIQESLEKLMLGRTCIIVAHRLSTVREADRIIVLNHGQVAEIGSHSELMARKGFYYQLQEVQT
jgi:ATP-binding cassette subfamily B protein